jgi:hypothetical protein
MSASTARGPSALIVNPENHPHLGGSVERVGNKRKEFLGKIRRRKKKQKKSIVRPWIKAKKTT